MRRNKTCLWFVSFDRHVLLIKSIGICDKLKFSNLFNPGIIF